MGSTLVLQGLSSLVLEGLLMHLLTRLEGSPLVLLGVPPV